MKGIMQQTDKENAHFGAHLDLKLAIELDYNCRFPTSHNTTNFEKKLYEQIICICDRCEGLTSKLKLTFINLKQAIVENHEINERTIENMSETPTEKIIKQLSNETMRIFTQITEEPCIRNFT
jgi:hypothetical protein